MVIRQLVRPFRSLPTFLITLATVLTVIAASGSARADGFGVDRHEPTPAGEWFFAVDHPWYTSTRDVAAGITLDYSHDALVYGSRDANGNFVQQYPALEHQLVLHFDVAVSLLDRLTFAASLPVVLVERGTSMLEFKPLTGVAAGDLRLGVMVRLLGHPDSDVFSLSAGVALWVPEGGAANHAGDASVRAMPKLVAGGFAKRLRWSATFAYLVRDDATLGISGGDAIGSTVGPEVQLGGAIAYADLKRHFAVGPEAVLASVVDNGHFFKKTFTSLEVLLGGHYELWQQVQLGLAAGFGVLRQPGTPDFRMLMRIAYAPSRKRRPVIVDSDGDGIPDSVDACPSVPGVANSDPGLNGCPAPSDRDHDGVVDAEDRCPDLAMGNHPDPARRGCPLQDTDGDGISDGADQCPTVPQGDHPDPKRPGCPIADSDQDGVMDDQDQCPTVPQGDHPDPKRPGCPIADRDGDGVPDAVDACPDVAGVATSDPKTNGCPALAKRTGGQIAIMEPIHFDTGKDVILPDSFGVLQAVADTIKANADIERLSIEGHTDNVGGAAFNQRLSERRAKSVVKWLTDHGVSADRLQARGLGQSKPRGENKTEEGRAQNRRVEFVIIKASPKPDEQ